MEAIPALLGLIETKLVFYPFFSHVGSNKLWRFDPATYYLSCSSFIEGSSVPARCLKRTTETLLYSLAGSVPRSSTIPDDFRHHRKCCGKYFLEQVQIVLLRGAASHATGSHQGAAQGFVYVLQTPH